MSLLLVAGPVSAGEGVLSGELLASHVTMADTAQLTVASALPIQPSDIAAALPPPPQKVVLENSYADVTVPHAKHLSARVACKSCHGPGPIRKIGRFQPREAHEACRGCHQTIARGPTECGGCHVKKPAPQVLAKASDAAVVERGPAAVDTSAVALTAFEAAASWQPPETASDGAEPLTARAPNAAPGADLRSRRTVFAGLSAVAASDAPASLGVSLGMTFHQTAYSLTELLGFSGGKAARTLGVIAFGKEWPVRERWTGHLQAAGGFDTGGSLWSSFLPVVGGRAGFEWASGERYVQFMDVSALLTDTVGQRRDPTGAPVGGAVFSLTASMGFDVSPRH